MKLPLTFNKKEDIPAIKWLIKFVVLYLLLSQILWNLDWFRSEIVGPYTKVLAWELEKILNLFGFEITRVQSTLSAQDSVFRVKIIPECTGFWGGYFVFLSVVTTLPASSFKSRAFWLIAGSAFIKAFNLLRLTVLLSLSFNDPDLFRPLHNILADVNLLAGGGISLFVVHRLSLVPAGVRAFKRRAGQIVEEVQASRLVDENSAG
jgi:exosortase/archaeosortase family protein